MTTCSSQSAINQIYFTAPLYACQFIFANAYYNVGRRNSKIHMMKYLFFSLLAGCSSMICMAVLSTRIYLSTVQHMTQGVCISFNAHDVMHLIWQVADIPILKEHTFKHIGDLTTNNYWDFPTFVYHHCNLWQTCDKVYSYEYRMCDTKTIWKVTHTTYGTFTYLLHLLFVA